MDEKKTVKKLVNSYRLKKDKIFEIPWITQVEILVLPAGEICTYFEHSDTYTFKSRAGVTPFFDRKQVEAMPDFFEPIDEELTNGRE